MYLRRISGRPICRTRLSPVSSAGVAAARRAAWDSPLLSICRQERGTARCLAQVYTWCRCACQLRVLDPVWSKTAGAIRHSGEGCVSGAPKRRAAAARADCGIESRWTDDETTRSPVCPTFSPSGCDSMLSRCELQSSAGRRPMPWRSLSHFVISATVVRSSSSSVKACIASCLQIISRDGCTLLISIGYSAACIYVSNIRRINCEDDEVRRVTGQRQGCPPHGARRGRVRLRVL